MKTLEVLDKVLRGRRLSESSRENYEAVFKNMAEYTDEFPSNLGMAQEWIASLDGYADTTVALWCSIAKSAGRYIKNVWNLDNPFEYVERPRVSKKKRRYWSVKELLEILRSCLSDEELLLVMTFIDSGCRTGGLASLLKDNVEDGFFKVVDKGIERIYRLDSRICERLKMLNEGSDYVFGGVSGSALSMRIIRIVRRAGFKGKKLGAHTIRHSVGSMIARETGSPFAVKAILQQDRIETANIYVHDVEEELQKSISPLEIMSRGIEEEQSLMLKSGVEEIDKEIRESEFIGDEFLLSEVGEGIEVRPLLKTEDLRLIKRIFEDFIKNGKLDRDVIRCRELYNRFLRKVKK